MRVIGVIEARMGSSRRPGKVLAEVVAQPLLNLIVERLRRSRRIDEIVIATSVETQDLAIEQWANKCQVPCYRGSEEDVRLGADQPFPDWELNDQLVDIYLRGGYDYVSNALTLSYPLGIVAQVYSEKTLAECEQLSRAETNRDGTSDYLWQHPERYRLFNLLAPPKLTAPDIRLTVDYPEDLELVGLIYEKLYRANPAFTLEDILAQFKANPHWREINGHISHGNRIEWPVSENG